MDRNDATVLDVVPVTNPDKFVAPVEYGAVANVCVADHVGVMLVESTGAASLRMNVDAAPLTADNPIEADGLAVSADSAVCPVPPFATGNVPVTPVVKGMAGMSPVTNARSDSAPVVPSGVASTRFAACPDAKPNVSVPADVTGEPDTLKVAGAASPTDDTAPVDVPTGAPSMYKADALMVPAPCEPPAGFPINTPPSDTTRTRSFPLPVSWIVNVGLSPDKLLEQAPAPCRKVAALHEPDHRPIISADTAACVT